MGKDFFIDQRDRIKKISLPSLRWIVYSALGEQLVTEHYLFGFGIKKDIIRERFN